MKKTLLKHSSFWLLSLILFLVMHSCGTRKEIAYLQQDSTVINTIYEQYIPKIQPSDILAITVSASDLKSIASFNQLNPYQMNGANSPDLAMKPTYTVDDAGYIDYPILGKLKVSGLTRIEAVELLKTQLKKYIIDPGVNISFSNFKVTVLGEVAKPGTFPLQTERITVLEALGLAGDMTIKGVRNNVLVIREVNGEKTMNRIDLTKQDALNSPYYYLAQNDVVYVEPNGSQVRNSRLGQNTNVWISVSSLIITIIAVIVSNRN